MPVLKPVQQSAKLLLTPGLIFEELGFRYVGPVDGHDVDSLVETFKRVKEMSGPILVHALTRKGKGFTPAEDDTLVFGESETPAECAGQTFRD